MRLPHNLIKEILTTLIEQAFNREGSLVCNDKLGVYHANQTSMYLYPHLN